MNNDSKENKLFKDFNPSAKKDWTEKATADLKGADFNKSLVWKNVNGFEIQPFYTREDQKEFLKNTGHNASRVVNYRRISVITDAVANTMALKAIEEGMNGILFEVAPKTSPATLLKNIDLNEITVSFIAEAGIMEFATAYKSYIEELGLDKTKIKGYFDLNFIVKYLTKGKLDKDTFDTLVSLCSLFTEFPKFKTLVVSGTVYQDAGSNQVQEIAYTLNSLVFLVDELTQRKLTPALIFDNLHFNLGISSAYFIEIAKFRAFKSLLTDIASKYGVAAGSTQLTGKTSVWSKSVTDANTNMLRATTEAMSALLGNADALEIDPYDGEFNKSNDFSSRIAGNITTILKEESYFGKVSNPVNGSYYIEELSLQLAKNALALFKDIEAGGGFYENIENETIQTQIAEIRFKKIKLLTQRRQSMVGVNKYPNLIESISGDILTRNLLEEDRKLLVPRRAGLELEQIRANTEKFVKEKGFRPVVEIASFGNLTMRKARAAFAYDFMGVAAYTINDEKSYASAQEGAEKSASSKSDIVVICSSDPDYQETALEFVHSFRRINSSKILLLAGFPENIQEQLIAAGLDGFIHVKSDIFNTLLEIQKKLTKTIKPLEI
jgi:methylmalonyl-CoA mutase